MTKSEGVYTHNRIAGEMAMLRQLSYWASANPSRFIDLPVSPT